MRKDSDNDFTETRNGIRKIWKKIKKQKSSIRQLCILWAKDAYALKCAHFAKESKDGQWLYDDIMESDIAPFKENVSESKKRLPSIALIQYLQMDDPLEIMEDSFHSRNWKYAAAFQYAHEQGWNAKKFAKEIDEKGGLSRLVKLYSESIKDDAADDEEVEESETDEVKDLAYYQAKSGNTIRKTEKAISEKFVGKIVIVRAHTDGFEILGKFPEGMSTA